jgi:ClpP class serine protease
MDPLGLLWIILILLSFQPTVQRQLLLYQRRHALAQMARLRSATIITLIHRQETLAFLGIPLVRHIDIDDSEGVLRAIRSTPPDRSIEILLHTPGGLVLAATQIAWALADHPGRVVAVVPHYAMSGGTLIALAADEIVMDSHAALGPVDPQIGKYPAADILTALEQPGDHDDETLILGEMSRKALRQVKDLVETLLARRLEPERARELAHFLAAGTWTHDHPLSAHELKRFGLPVQVGVPAPERELLELYPQPRARPSQVEYAGTPSPPGRIEPARGRPRTG